MSCLLYKYNYKYKYKYNLPLSDFLHLENPFAAIVLVWATKIRRKHKCYHLI